MFDTSLDVDRFDRVFSLGLAEHFEDTTAAAGAHLRFLKPAGTLIIGMPNFRGINGWFARRINPKPLATHNVESMQRSTWDNFESQLGPERLYRGFIGALNLGFSRLPMIR